MDRRRHGIPGLEPASILCLSVTAAPDRPCAPLFRSRIDPGPAADLGRIPTSSGSWAGEYVRPVLHAACLDWRTWPRRLGIDGLVVRTKILERTSDGRRDPIFEGCRDPIPTLAIHHDYLVDLPRGARVLAHCEDLPNRVVAVGERVRLFQPHPELTVESARHLLSILEDRLVQPGEWERLRPAAEHLRPTRQINRNVVASFLRMCGR